MEKKTMAERAYLLLSEAEAAARWRAEAPLSEWAAELVRFKTEQARRKYGRRHRRTEERNG